MERFNEDIVYLFTHVKPTCTQEPYMIICLHRYLQPKLFLITFTYIYSLLFCENMLKLKYEQINI